MSARLATIARDIRAVMQPGDRATIDHGGARIVLEADNGTDAPAPAAVNVSAVVAALRPMRPRKA